MEHSDKIIVRNVKQEGDILILIIEKNGKKETLKLEDEIDTDKVKFATLSLIQTLTNVTPDSQDTLLKVMNRIYFIYRSSKVKTNAYLTTIAESNFHEFCESVMAESLTNGHKFTEQSKAISSSIYSVCHNVSDNCSTFVDNIWSTKIIEVIKCNLCNPLYLEKKDDSFYADMIESSLGILHNTTRHIDASQREILSTKTLKHSLTKFFEWSEEVSLAALFTLSMIIDPNETDLLENQTKVVNHAMNLAIGAFESNLRRQNGYHLDELLSGLYYSFRSDKIKLSVMKQNYIGFFFEIIQMMDRPSEVQGALIIFKQLSRCPAVKLKLINEFKIVSILKNCLETAYSYMKSTIQDLINIYSVK